MFSLNSIPYDSRFFCNNFPPVSSSCCDKIEPLRCTKITLILCIAIPYAASRPRSPPPTTTAVFFLSMVLIIVVTSCFVLNATTLSKSLPGVSGINGFDPVAIKSLS